MRVDEFHHADAVEHILDTVFAFCNRVFTASSVRLKSRTGYRFFTIQWAADPAFVDFTIQWRNEGEGEADWETLGAKAAPGARVIMRAWNYEADLRGIDPGPGAIQVRVVGQMEEIGGFQSHGPALDVERMQPISIGRLKDHTMRYDITGLGISTLAGWVRDAAPSAATAWSNVVSSLMVCDYACRENGDGEVVNLDIVTGRPCSGRGACVTDTSANFLMPAISFTVVVPRLQPHRVMVVSVGVGAWSVERGPLPPEAPPLEYEHAELV